MKTICSCCKKKKATNSSYVSEVNNILTNKKALIQLDSMKLNSQKGTPMHNNNVVIDYIDDSNNTNNQNKLISKSFGFPTTKIRIKNGILFNNKLHQKNNTNEKRFFHELKDKVRCVFCGGKDCKHENYLNNLDNENAIEGLNSNFITDWVIASQRPSEVLIKEFELVSKFKEFEIDLIVNLQREGEHPYCGPNAYNLTAAGYSYNPSMFTGDNIKCKLSGWKDMSVPSSMNFMLEIVKDMTQTVNDMQKRVLVHCHAGYGRTGVVIASYLLYNSDKDSETVISEIRAKRKKCIESNDQQSFCKKFHNFLCQIRMLFDKKEPIDVYLKRQEDLLCGNEASKYGYIPKLMTKTMEKIINLKEKYSLQNIEIFSLVRGIKIEWDDEYEKILDMLKLLLNKNNWKLFDQIENLIIIVELLFDWFEDYVDYVISPEKTELIVYSDLFINYQNQIKGNQSNNVKPELVEELFTFIRKIYHCFEYETIFQIASFCSLISPVNDNEMCVFNSMIERVSFGLLGFSFTENNVDKSIEALVVGLSGIIQLLHNTLITEESDEKMQMIHPLRKSTCILSSKKQSVGVKSPDKDMRTEGNSKVLSVSPISSPLMCELRKLKNSPSLDAKERKLINAFEYLTHHFNENKEMFDKIDDIAQIEPLNEIPKKSNENQSMFNFIKNDEAKVIEEPMQNNSIFSSNSSKNNLSNIEERNTKQNEAKHAQIQTSSYSNVLINNYSIKAKPNNIKPDRHSMCKPFDRSLNKRSSLITFESFRRSLFLNNDTKLISSLATVIKKDIDTKAVYSTCFPNTNFMNLPKISKDPELMKELAMFRERKSQRNFTSKSRNSNSKSLSSSVRRSGSKFCENKNERFSSFR